MKISKVEALGIELQDEVLKLRSDGKSIPEIISILKLENIHYFNIKKYFNINKRAKKYIAEEFDGKIIKYAAQGMTLLEISQKMNCQTGSISQSFKRLNINIVRIRQDQKDEIIKLINLGVGREEIARAVNLNTLEVRKFCKELGLKNKGLNVKKMTAEIEIKIINLNKLGYTVMQIAKEVNFARKNIRLFLQKRNIPLSTLNEQQKEDIKICKQLRSAISRLIHIKLKRKSGSKEGKSISDYLPYSIEEFKSHIEGLFEPWMNWGNKGKYVPSKWDDNDQSTWVWNLDHIIPASLFIYNSMEGEEFQKCWALSNLRPYSAKQNIIDGVRRTRHIPR